MLSPESQRIAEKAKALYDNKLRMALEAAHHGEYVCIEPESGSYFLGETFDAAVNQAIDSCPDRRTHTLRIGRAAALHLGAIDR